jgi:DNA invertase Pin-like site-specific DNA recombinase
MKSAVYVRISDDRTGDRAGVDRQEKECMALADRLGWEVVAVCSDNSFSAYQGKRRPGFEELRDLIRSHKVDAVIAWAADRLTRHPRELEDLVDLLDETGTRVQTVTSGEYDLTTADGRAHARILGAISTQESQKKGERVRSQKRQAAAKGERPGGPRAFGWTAGRQDVIPDEIAVVREMADRVLGGEGLATIVKDLNRRGIRTARGNTWARNVVRGLLTNPATAGLRRQPDGGVVEGEWQGAYSRQTWNQLCAVLADPARKTTHRLRSYLLTGLVYDEQGRRMVPRYRKQGGTRIYRTPPHSGGNGVQITAGPVEELVTEAVLRVTDDLEIPEPTDEQHTEQVEAIQGQLDELAAMWGRGELTAGEWNAARGPLRVRLGEARREERRAPGVLEMDWGRPGLLRAAWEGLTLQQRRQALDLFIDRVVIAPGGPANTVDLNRVRVVWKA